MNKFQEIISQDKPVLVDFFAEWCGPCKMQAPILQDLKKAIGDSANIIKIDVDKNQAVAAQFGIRSVPTLMIFKNEEVKWKQSGVFQADELEKLIKQNI
ncbi:thioredoxin [uncultured Chryseobacterium sp.]|uniref:thioredoxin n=1 Tax=uncultured Chryseobacterium sp. TaxID=259322 RepID=UPI00374836EA